QVVMDVVLRRPPGDGVGDEEWHDRHDEYHPAELHEQREEGPAQARVGGELREVGGEVPVRLPRAHRGDREDDAGGEDRAARPERKRQEDEPERRGQHAGGDDRDGRPEPDVVQMRSDGIPRHHRDGENDERLDPQATPGDRQYGGVWLHHSPSTLKAFQNAVFPGCSSSDSSMSGVTSPWIVGVYSCSSPSRGFSSWASGKRAALRQVSASSSPSALISVMAFCRYFS